MSKKIARITKNKKLLLIDKIVENNTKISLNDSGKLDVGEIIEYPPILEGGRNLLKSSKSLFLTGSDYGDRTIREIVNNEYGRIEVVKEGYWNSYVFAHNLLTDKKIFSDSNSKYTLSLDVRTNRENIATIHFDIRRLPGHANIYRSDRTVIPNTNGKWERVSTTMTIPDDQLKRNALLIQFVGLESVVGDVIEYRNIKLEKGSQATPWTPAPEDLGLNYPDSIQNFNSSISGNNIIAPEFIEGYPFVKPVIDDSLILWLDGSTGNNYEKTNIWKDLSGNGNDGQLMNFGYTEDSGWGDDGLRFDGVDDYVDCGNVEDLNSDGLTIEIMCKNDERDLPISITKGQNGMWARNDFGLRTDIFYISDKSDNLNQLLGVRPQQGKLNHIICRTSQKLGKLEAYINSVKVAEMTRTIDDIKITNQNVHINTRYTGGKRDKGEVKLVRIYNRALTDEEILQNYQAGQCSPLLAMRGDAIG